MIHCLWLCPCSGNKLSHQQRSRAIHHPLWDRCQSHCTLSSTDHKVNTINSSFGHMSAFHYKELQKTGSLVLMPHLSSSSEMDLKPGVLVYAVLRKKEEFNIVLLLFIPYPTSSKDNYTSDEKALLMPPTVYQRNLNTSKKRKKKTKKSWSRRKWK